jgi:hypothetical protein
MHSESTMLTENIIIAPSSNEKKVIHEQTNWQSNRNNFLNLTSFICKEIPSILQISFHLSCDVIQRGRLFEIQDLFSIFEVLFCCFQFISTKFHQVALYKVKLIECNSKILSLLLDFVKMGAFISGDRMGVSSGRYMNGGARGYFCHCFHYTGIRGKIAANVAIHCPNWLCYRPSTHKDGHVLVGLRERPRSFKNTSQPNIMRKSFALTDSKKSRNAILLSLVAYFGRILCCGAGIASFKAGAVSLESA